MNSGNERRSPGSDAVLYMSRIEFSYTKAYHVKYRQKYKKVKMTISNFFSTFHGLLSEIMRNKD